MTRGRRTFKGSLSGVALHLFNNTASTSSLFISSVNQACLLPHIKYTQQDIEF